MQGHSPHLFASELLTDRVDCSFDITQLHYAITVACIAIVLNILITLCHHPLCLHLLPSSPFSLLLPCLPCLSLNLVRDLFSPHLAGSICSCRPWHWMAHSGRSWHQKTRCTCVASLFPTCETKTSTESGRNLYHPM
jgi:hypothetical protein